ncbi:16S rRNA (guanine(527)-N(7))-methyltransferase RsmG [Sulfobacillus sp. hq2]|nr:16S rRNA (guanine(527)-N(7))-methyltransferase RsmG [Sulfobacillus sp. hq2]
MHQAGALRPRTDTREDRAEARFLLITGQGDDGGVEIPQWVTPEMAKKLQSSTYEAQLMQMMTELLDVPMNVTGFRTIADLWDHGVLDAVYSLQAVDMTKVRQGVDIGSGGGFPGMVMAILYPEVEWVLVESRAKRADFLEDMSNKLGLENVTVFAQRAEDMIQMDPSWRESAEFVTARAVGPLAIALELSVPFMAVDGYGVYPKGSSQAADEVRVAKSLGRRLGAEFVSVSEPYGPRLSSRLVTVKKVHPTPVMYPRKARELGDRG